MSVASEFIGDLDAEMRESGQDIVLHRQGDDDGAPGTVLRAFVRGYRPEELSGGVQQGDSQVVISPTALAAVGLTDPIMRLDAVTIAGRRRTVEIATPVAVDGAVVRIELWVKG